MLLTCTTGKRSERVSYVPISRGLDGPRRVVMSLGRPPQKLPRLQPGDRLEVSAEAEVTTDCQKAGRGCFRNPDAGGKAHPYSYAPIVTARLLLCGEPETTGAAGGAVQLAEAREEACTHEMHHLVFAFCGAGLEVPDGGLPWLPGTSYVNLVLDARHPDAGPGDVLLVGENEPDGTVKGDKGRINAVRRRPGCPQGNESSGPPAHEEKRVPVDKEARTVVCSRRVGRLEKDDQLVVEARLETSAAHLAYPARISTRLFLADDPRQDDTGGDAASIAPFGGEISENNGFNCKGGAVSRKVGVLRAERDSRKDLYVNLVAVSSDPFGGAGANDALAVKPGGFIRVTRFPAALCG